MKQIKYKHLIILTLLATISMIYSCKKAFLDKTPIGTLNPSILANAQGVQGVLIGAYSLLDGEGGNGSGWGSAASNWVYGSVCADDAYKGSTPSDQGDIFPLEKWTGTSSNPYPQGKWSLCYDGVQRANEVLRLIPIVTDMSAAAATLATAEARFLRGHYHFELKKVFNNVPYVDETVVSTTDPAALTNIAGSGYVNIWPQIEADFQFAAANLPEVMVGAGRVNKWAAMAYLAKAYMFQSKYDLAKPLFDQIITSGKTSSNASYGLNDNYYDNFNAATKNSKESVFAAQMSVNDGSASAQNNGLGVSNGNYGDVLNFPYNGGPTGCCGFFNPSQSLGNAFKTTAGLPLLDTYNQGASVSAVTGPYAGTLDPRIDWVMGRPGIPYLDWGLVPSANEWIREDQGPNYRYVPKKNVYEKAQKGAFSSTENYWANNQLVANNVNLMRFSDVLLMAAECEIKAAGGDPVKALDYVNRVRTRAGLTAGFVHTYVDNSDPSKGFTATPAANYAISNYPAGSFADPVFAMKAIMFERRLELAMEGHRFFDLVRWGVAKATLDQYALDEHNFNNSYTFYETPVFTAGKSEYFAIPINQINILNSKGTEILRQNPGYQ
jgi:starch-binding outer membrane protein, SusD/RagB family